MLHGAKIYFYKKSIESHHYDIYSFVLHYIIYIYIIAFRKIHCEIEKQMKRMFTCLASVLSVILIVL